MKSGKNILSTYLNRLTNLTGNNRSILLLKLTAEQFIDLHQFNMLDHQASFTIIERLMNGKSTKLCQVLDSRLEANNRMSEHLRRLQRMDRFLFEERGSNDLHIGWPFARGKFTDGTLVRAPLLFFPVSVVQMQNEWMLVPREDAGIVINKSFVLAYCFYNKVDLPTGLLEQNFEDFDGDSTVWRTQLYQLLKEHLEINFNPENFRDELTAFEVFSKDDFTKQHQAGEIKLFPEAVLGIFPQAGSQLVPDYRHLLDAENFADLEDFFYRRQPTTAEGGEGNAAGMLREENLYTPFEIDAWQERALRSIKAGKSLVIQGPPGTGKSQTICNLIADALSSGKKILLVSQKRAALDVVFQRLQKLELQPFLALVHDFRNDRRTLYEQIARQVEQVDSYRAANRNVDIIQMERRYFQVSRAIDNITEEMDEFRNTLFNDEECGVPVKELYLTSNPEAPVINCKQEFQFFRLSELDIFLRKMKSYLSYAGNFAADRYAWGRRKSFAGYRLEDRKAIAAILKEIPATQETFAQRVRQLIPVDLHLENLESLLGREDDILGMLSVLKDDETYGYFIGMLNEKDEETNLLWLSNTERLVMNCFEDDGPEIETPSDQLGRLQLALQHSLASRRSLFLYLRWKFSDQRFWLKRTMVANNLPYSKEGLRALERRLDSRLNLEHHLTALKAKTWLTEVPTVYQPENFRVWFERKKFAVRAKIIFNSLRELREHLKPARLTRYEFNRMFHNILSIGAEIPPLKTKWLRYLTPFQVRQLIHEPQLKNEYADALKKDFDNLREFDELSASLQPHEQAVLEKLHEQLGDWDFEHFSALLYNSLAICWIDYIETKYPVLRIASSMKLNEMQQELRSLLKEKKRLSKDIILMRAREQVYEKIEYNRLNNRVTYRDLHHQVTKQKKRWPLRKLIMEMQQDLFKLVPCWLTSPESASAIFPMKEIFDLVIFDEASQCFAERGIPTMYRGRQVVIAGDDKQLKPFELYQVRWDEESDHPDDEVDSLLGLAERYLEPVHLQGHYRSRSPELIDFSNRHFYGGRLKLLPDRTFLNSRQPAIAYCKVEGVWADQVNMIEATKVVNFVFDLLRDEPTLTLGVVTFNAPQQMLIMDLLEDRSVKEQRPLPETLMVKNIENVQGDEKDVILFSIGYAPDARGKMVMQFGSLNTAGGENRLNVAITRARQKVIIVTSILPEQLKVSGSSNPGPRLLKAYLAFAQEVQSGAFTPTHPEEKRHKPSWYLTARLKEWAEGHFRDAVFEEHVFPFTDLCIRQNNNYQAAILTDDERYFQGLSAKEVHAYTPEQLKQKQWDHRFIFSRNYWINREQVENDITRLMAPQKG